MARRRKTNPTYRLTGFNRASVPITWGVVLALFVIEFVRELVLGRMAHAVIVAVIFVPIAAALTRHVVRLATFIELDDADLRWRNALGRWRSKPLVSLVSIGPSRVGIFQVFAFKDGTRFKTSTRPGFGAFVTEVAARGRGVEVSSGWSVHLGEASGYLAAGIDPGNDQDAPDLGSPKAET